MGVMVIDEKESFRECGNSLLSVFATKYPQNGHRRFVDILLVKNRAKGFVFA